mmetsp:Transcript_85073/g.148354  ORF Transcript_85073/g.148354 Transcript_85073/m.148354 type:complete len:121 (-) Transcript_85073:106-468(-)
MFKLHAFLKPQILGGEPVQKLAHVSLLNLVLSYNIQKPFLCTPQKMAHDRHSEQSQWRAEEPQMQNICGYLSIQRLSCQKLASGVRGNEDKAKDKRQGSPAGDAIRIGDKAASQMHYRDS